VLTLTASARETIEQILSSPTVPDEAGIRMERHEVGRIGTRASFSIPQVRQPFAYDLPVE
jgi:hypothetical protein